MYFLKPILMTLVLGIFLGIFIMPGSSYAQTTNLNPCFQAKPVEIEIKVGATPLKHEYSKTAAEITYISATQGTVPYEMITPKGIKKNRKSDISIPENVDYSGNEVQGLYTPNFGISYQTYYDEQFNPDTRTYCIALSKIIAEITMQPTVFVARETNYRNRKKCFNSILKHEETHDKISKTVAAEYREKLRKNFEFITYNNQSYGPVTAEQKNKISAGIDQKVEIRFGKVIDLLFQEEDRRQDAFHESDESHTSECDKFGKELAKNIKRSNLFDD